MYCASVQDPLGCSHLCVWEWHVSWGYVTGVDGCRGCFLDGVCVVGSMHCGTSGLQVGLST